MQFLTRLNAKAGISEGFGGVPELTVSDIAAALAGADPAGLSLLLCQVCGESDFKALYATFYPEAIKLSKRLKWRSAGSIQARTGKLLEVVLFEAMCDKKCPSCRGTQYSLLDPSKPCRTCKGTGSWMVPDYVKAEYIGVSKGAFSRVWLGREDELRYLLDRRLYRAETKIFDNLYGE